MRYLTKHQIKIMRNSLTYLPATKDFRDSYHPARTKYVTVDTLIAPILSMLNNKGYFTEWSCAGHGTKENPRPYIMFKKDKSKIFHFAPKGWYIDREDWDELGQLCIRIIPRCPMKKHHSYKQMIKHIQLYLKYLYEWAVKL